MQAAGTVKAAELCARLGLDYHVVDSEWRENYISPSELEDLLEFSERNSSNLKTIVTISARHMSSVERTRKLIEIMKRHESASLNLVAGNRVYLAEKEVKRSAAKRLANLARIARRCLRDRVVFIGTEGLTEMALEIATEHDLVPFLLLDKDLESDVDEVHDTYQNSRIAVYVPYLTKSCDYDISAEAVRRLWRYAFRRRWVRKDLEDKGYDLRLLEVSMKHERNGNCNSLDNRIAEVLMDPIGKLSVCGDAEGFIRAFQNFKKLGISTVIGFPLREEERQVLTFSRCIHHFRRHRV